MTSCHEALLAALAEQSTINVREVMTASLGRVPSKSEIATARRAARGIAEEGAAVLMTLYPGQAEGLDSWKWGRQAVLHLTVDRRVVTELPCRVEVAVGSWEKVVAEGMRQTKKEIENDPMLSALLPGWGAGLASTPEPA